MPVVPEERDRKIGGIQIVGKGTPGVRGLDGGVPGGIRDECVKTVDRRITRDDPLRPEECRDAPLFFVGPAHVHRQHDRAHAKDADHNGHVIDSVRKRQTDDVAFGQPGCAQPMGNLADPAVKLCIAKDAAALLKRRMIGFAARVVRHRFRNTKQEHHL